LHIYKLVHIRIQKGLHIQRIVDTPIQSCERGIIEIDPTLNSWVKGFRVWGLEFFQGLELRAFRV
jgi:hypothetical protein